MRWGEDAATLKTFYGFPVSWLQSVFVWENFSKIFIIFSNNINLIVVYEAKAKLEKKSDFKSLTI